MKPVWNPILITVFVCAGAIADKGTGDLLPYPAPEDGYARWVFHVPAVEMENDRKVEIIAGKTLLVDCNRTWFGGNLEQQTAKGWGYSYYVLENAAGPASTRMACPQKQKPTAKFVPVRGKGFLQGYNSRLPMVVYVPDGFEVRYRIWSADEHQAAARRE